MNLRQLFHLAVVEVGSWFENVTDVTARCAVRRGDGEHPAMAVHDFRNHRTQLIPHLDKAHDPGMVRRMRRVRQNEGPNHLWVAGDQERRDRPQCSSVVPYDHRNAARMAALGAPVFACTPEHFPEMMAAALSKQDLYLWAEQRGLKLERPEA